MSTPNTAAAISKELGRFLLPLRDALASGDAFARLAWELGWEVSSVPTALSAVTGALDTLSEILEDLEDEETEFTLETADSIRDAVREIVAAIHAIETASDIPATLVDDGFLEKFPGQLLEYLAIEYLRDEHPAVGGLIEALGVIQQKYEEPSGNRPASVRRTLDFEAIPEILNDPTAKLIEVIGWGAAEFQAWMLLSALDDLLISIGVATFVETLDTTASFALEDDVEIEGNPVRRALKAVLFNFARAGAEAGAGIRFYPLPTVNSKLPGIAVMPYLSGDVSGSFEITEGLILTVEGGFDLEGGLGIRLRPGDPIDVVIGFDSDDDATTAEGMLTVRLEYVESFEDESIMLLGTRGASRLEVEGISLAAGLYASAGDEPELYGEIELRGGRVVIDAGDGDGFLQKVLSNLNMEIPFDLTVGLSTLRGLYFGGSGALEVTVPTHVEIGGLTFSAITVSVSPADGAIEIELGASMSLELGPLVAAVDNMGFRVDVAVPGAAGENGPVEVELGFKPPEGIGLSVDSSGITGGGFLAFDAEEEKYAGAVELSFRDTLSLTAVGLLTTRLPGNEDGFSLLVIISAEFTPIQLGLGFTLNGVGGLLGIHRTVRTDEMREGVKSGAMDDVLFPTNIVANADRIISNLETFFPAEEGRYVLGPMAKFGWGTPTLITVELGLIIELPDPVQIAILGVLKMLLPDEDLKVVSIQVNFLGTVDFDQHELSFDASLFDSKLLTFTLDGDMALRMRWQDGANFLMSVGGFHPSYEPPPLDLPSMMRLTVNLLGGDNPRLTLETYVALTSNTAQLGASVELYAAAGNYNVYGFLGFDVLFQFDPFYFIATLAAQLAVRRNTTELLSVTLTGSLEGPTPWRAQGKAEFKILGIKLAVSFDKSFGNSENNTLPDVDVLEKLIESLKQADNWKALPPLGLGVSVTLRDTGSSGDLLVHPAGTLTVAQKVVPLEVTIDRFGSGRPEDEDRFEITRLAVSGETVDSEDVREEFAPAQFFDMSDAEKISRNSFEKMVAGAASTTDGEMDTGAAVTREVEYEQIVIDRSGQRNFLGRRGLQLGVFDALIRANGAANAIRPDVTGTASILGPAAVSLGAERYTVVGAADLVPSSDAGAWATETEALTHLSALIEANPSLDGEIQVVPEYEAVRA